MFLDAQQHAKNTIEMDKKTLQETVDLTPLVSLKALLDPHSTIIRRLREQLALDPLMEERLFWPVIERGAGYFHRLPASEAHHHCEEGGLLKHSLEVAAMTLMFGEKHLYDADQLPSIRKSREVGWRYALFVAGWLHDAGKLVNGLRIWETKTGSRWTPYRESILEWGQRLDLSGYRYHWRPGRGTGHHRLNPILMEPLLGPQALGYLLDQGADLVQALTDALIGLSEEREIYPYLSKADNHSAGLDFKSLSRHATKGGGYALDQQLVNALRRTFRSKRWQINQPGTVIWHIDSDLYFIWPDAGLEIIRQAHFSEAYGVPGDPNALADLLLEFGIADYFRGPDDELLRYARLQPETLKTPRQMLKLASVSILFDGAIPFSVKQHHPVEDHLLSNPPSIESINPDDANHIESSKEPETSEDTATHLSTWILQYPNPERLLEWIQKLADTRNALPVMTDGRGFIPHPETSKQLGYAPKEILELLTDAEWIVTDPLIPRKRVMTHHGITGLFLKPEVARWINAVLASKTRKAAEASDAR